MCKESSRELWVGANGGDVRNKLFFVAPPVVTENYTLPAVFNALYLSPLTISDGKTLDCQWIDLKSRLRGNMSIT